MDQTNNGRLSEAIALQIAELILSGEMKNGTKLRQEELAGMLQVSRIPVREALQLLETQGLAKRLATRHIVTAELTDEHIRQMYAMIADIEYSAVESIRVEMRADEDDGWCGCGRKEAAAGAHGWTGARWQYGVASHHYQQNIKFIHTDVAYECGHLLRELRGKGITGTTRK